MLTAFLATAVLALSGQQDAKEFRDSFALRNGDSASAKADPAIQKCMDIVIGRLRKDITPSSPSEQIQQLITYFSREVAAEETFETSYRSVGASIAWGPGKVAIGIRMGAVSRLRVFNTISGKVIPVPTALDWSYQFDAAPQFLPGGLLIVNGAGIQDAGVRYGYRILFLKPSEKGYLIAQVMRGIWTLEDESESHLGTNGLVGTVRTIEPPKSFFTDNTTRLFVHETIYELGSIPFKTRMQTYGHDAVRAVDDWMATAMKSPKTDLQKKFVAAYGKEPKMIDSFEEKVVNGDSFEVKLKFEELTFVYIVQRKGGKYLIKSMKTVG